jgi:hypothetical protein
MIGEAGHAYFNYALTFVLQLRKSTESLSQARPLMLDTSRCVDLSENVKMFMVDTGLGEGPGYGNW